MYEKVKQIPLGKVTTYGEIARVIGINNPRVEGYTLHANKLFLKFLAIELLLKMEVYLNPLHLVGKIFKDNF